MAAIATTAAASAQQIALSSVQRSAIVLDVLVLGVHPPHDENAERVLRRWGVPVVIPATSGQQEPDLELTDNRSLIVGTSSLDSPAYMGLLSTLIEWHQADPPDEAEGYRVEVRDGA